MDIQFFTQNPPIAPETISKLLVSDLYERGSVRHLADINNTMNPPLNLVTYMRIGTTLTNFFNNHNRHAIQNRSSGSVRVEQFITRFKKGSKPFRKIIAHARIEKTSKKIKNTFKNLFEICQIPTPETDDLKKIGLSWNYGTYPNKLKYFLFQFVYNRLKTNTRLSHSARGEPVDRACTFCTADKNLPAPEETFRHLFWDCPSVDNLKNQFFETIFPEMQDEQHQTQILFWFTGLYNRPYPALLNVARSTFLYNVWEMHKKKCALRWHTFKINFYFELKKITESTSPSTLGIGNIHFYLTRNWDTIAREEATFF